jgi:nucleoside-diphosphate-sugar epimerase
MRAFVTGATGFLGSHLALRLAAAGHGVRVLARPTSDLDRLREVPHEVAIGDVTDPASFRTASSGVDVVFHCAAMYEMGPADPSRMEAVNIGGVEAAIAASVDAGATLVHVSSVTAHGPTGTIVRDESYWADTEPLTHYERTKREGHLAARRAAVAGADVRIVSPGGIYGPGDTSTLGNMIERYMTTPSPIGWRPLGMQSTVNVDDAADLLVRVAEHGAPGDEYLACAQAVTFREWFAEIAGAAGRRPPFLNMGDGTLRAASRLANAIKPVLGQRGPMVSEYLATMGCDYAFSGDKARRELGWVPVDLADGMRAYASAIGAARG